jgi:hypothetical protein
LAETIVKIAHKLGKEEALRRIKPALGKASSSFPMRGGVVGRPDDVSRPRPWPSGCRRS